MGGLGTQQHHREEGMQLSLRRVEDSLGGMLIGFRATFLKNRVALLM